MDPATDLVEHFRLDVAFFPDHTRHTFYHSDCSQNRRKVKVVKRWVKQHELGEGGGGTVWLEKDSEGDERAVKQILKGFCLRNHLDYRKEITAMAKLTKHPELFVELHGWFDDDTKVFLAMEYFKHGDLQNFMDVPLPERDVGIITRQLLEGLNVMHKYGFTHRDLKPQNIFVVADFPTWWVKIGDFGIAKRIMNDQTALRTEVGTRDYQAPEVLGFMDPEEELLYTSAVDLWALGCVMYRLLTLEKPFPKPSSLRLYCHSMKNFPVEPLYAKDVSENAVEFIRQLMRAHPPERLDAETALKSDWRSLQNSISGSETGSIAEEKIAAEIPVHEGNTLLTQAITTTTLSEQDTSKSEDNADNGNSTEVTVIGHARSRGRIVSPQPESSFEVSPGEESSDGSLDLEYLSAHGEMCALERDAAILKQLHQAGYFIGVETTSADLTAHPDATIALHWAAKSGSYDELRYLLDKGVCVSAMEIRSQRRIALHYAAGRGWIKAVDILIKRGSYLEARDANSWSPLHCAAHGGHRGVCETLLKAGASVRSLNSFLETPLHCAARNGYIQVIKLLLDWGADKAAKDLRGFTPFGRARLAKYTFEVLRVPELKKGQ